MVELGARKCAPKGGNTSAGRFEGAKQGWLVGWLFGMGTGNCAGAPGLFHWLRVLLETRDSSSPLRETILTYESTHLTDPYLTLPSPYLPLLPLSIILRWDLSTLIRSNTNTNTDTGTPAPVPAATVAVVIAVGYMMQHTRERSS
ncbi:hypothetical protein M0804_006926 [Polistes exclamans]|nr:hypothetical protein M0804_006926 [Polistes exclamans]